VTAKSDLDAAWDVVDLIDKRFETFRKLIDEREVDVAHLTVFYINVLQHYFWRGEPTAAAWKTIDKHIGGIREAHPDTTLFLMSDHGCAEIDTMFYANSWLEREGFLETTRGASSILDRLGVNQTRVSKLAQRLGIHRAVQKLTPELVKQRVPVDEEGAKREQKLDRVDWENTRAVASGQGLIYVVGNDKETRDEIIARLNALNSDVTGTPVAREVLTREQAYTGEYVSDAPAIVFDQTPGIHTSGAIGDNPVFEDVSHWEAENVRTGLFLAAGPDVTGTIDRPVSITDVAPTILHSVNCPVPTDVDGSALELFQDGDPGTIEPVTPAFVDSDSAEEVTDRLEDLGYLQ
jgi:predicted AlkP superfamily phosphohydrolase/phosphomutase